MTRIALDAAGGDHAPEVPVAGALEALEALPETCEIVLVGPETSVRAEVERHGPVPKRISVVDAPEVIGMGEKPLAAIRAKRKSSIVVGLSMHKAGEVDAFISAGNTGAMMAAGTLLLGLHAGIERPAIGAALPALPTPVLLLDAGANVDCSARELVGFAHLGSVYARDVLEKPRPAVGLLNIGEEETKGNTIAREARALLAREPALHFIGNVEGSDVLRGDCDVIVCDGFVGNIVLKFYESTGRIFGDVLRQELSETALEVEGMDRVFAFLDYSTYGGAPLLGVRGVAVICHGRSSSRAIANALRVARRSVEHHLSDHIGVELAHPGAVA